VKRTCKQSLLVALLLAVAAGCQPEKQLAVAHRTFAVTMDYLSEQREAGNISDETQRKVVAPARDATKKLLDELSRAFVEGRPINWLNVRQLIRETMLPLLRLRYVLEETNALPH
jgi:hypothetical protein